MEEQQSAVQDFLSNAGKNDTSVAEKVDEAVTHETVQPTEHEIVQTAVNKEVQQDHYHTSVQPIADSEVLPETHSHNLVAIEERVYDHGDDTEVQRRLDEEKLKYQNERTVLETTHSSSTAAVAAGEHVHHHVHETIQPIIQREVIQPSVVHTTIPVHEIHHYAAQYHATSALPAISMEDFKRQGGVLGGRSERYDAYAGEPRDGSANVGDTTTGKQAFQTRMIMERLMQMPFQHNMVLANGMTQAQSLLKLILDLANKIVAYRSSGFSTILVAYGGCMLLVRSVVRVSPVNSFIKA